MRSLRPLFFLASVATACLAAKDAHAGQLMIDTVTLGDVARAGIAVLGTVVSTLAAQRQVRVKVKKVWQRRENKSAVMDRGRPVGTWFRDVREFTLYGGVVWDDPQISPVDRRVPGALDIADIHVGQEVIVVSSMGFEVVPADPRTLAKLDIFFADDGVARYRAKTPPAQLFADLRDADLREPALMAMRERNLLEPAAFLALPEHLLFDLGWQLAQSLSGDELNAWTLQMIAAVKDGPRRLRLADLMRETTVAAKLTTQTQLALIRTLDLDEDGQAARVSWFLRDEYKALQATQGRVPRKVLADLALKWEARRRDSASAEDDELLRGLLKALLPAERIEVVTRLGTLIMTTPAAKRAEEKLDGRLCGLFLAAVERSPDRAYLAPLAAIDLSHYPEVSQGRVESRVAVLDAGLAIAEADPTSRDEVYAALKKWVRDEKLFAPDMAISLSSSQSPGDMKRHWQDTLKRFKALAR